MNSSIKKFAVLFSLLSLMMLSSLHAAENDIIGTGSSLSAKAFLDWANEFQKNYPNKVGITYTTTSSGEGIRRITSRTVDFTVSDIPLTQSELSQDDLVQFPMLLAGIVPVINLPGIQSNALVLSPEVLSGIFLGKITQWNDEKIQSINRSVDLPNLPIHVLYRKDGSGTSFVYTSYLSQISKEWNERHGIGSKLIWPTGTGARGTEAIKEILVKQPGSISYVEYGYAMRNQLTVAKLLNSKGEIVSADERTIKKAADQASWGRQSYYESLVNLSGDGVWPIVAVSYVLVHQTKTDEQDIKDTLTFLDWIFHSGSKIGSYNQVILIDNGKLINQIENTWLKMRSDRGYPVWKLHGATK